MPQFKSLGKLQEHFEIYGFVPKIFLNALLELGVKKEKVQDVMKDTTKIIHTISTETKMVEYIKLKENENEHVVQKLVFNECVMGIVKKQTPHLQPQPVPAIQPNQQIPDVLQIPFSALVISNLNHHQ
jgi:CBS-domain-containing membrane protein